MGTNECSQPASKSSWDSQDFGDVNMVFKMAHFHKSSRPQWVKRCKNYRGIRYLTLYSALCLLMDEHIYRHDEEDDSVRRWTPWGRNKMAAIFQTAFSNAFSWMKMYKFLLRFHWSLFLVPKGTINNIPALVRIMAWRRPGDKPLSEPMMVSLLTHICVTRPQWVNVKAPLTVQTLLIVSSFKYTWLQNCT